LWQRICVFLCQKLNLREWYGSSTSFFEKCKCLKYL